MHRFLVALGLMVPVGGVLYAAPPNFHYHGTHSSVHGHAPTGVHGFRPGSYTSGGHSTVHGVHPGSFSGAYHSTLHGVRPGSYTGANHGGHFYGLPGGHYFNGGVAHYHRAPVPHYYNSGVLYNNGYSPYRSSVGVYAYGTVGNVGLSASYVAPTYAAYSAAPIYAPVYVAGPQYSSVPQPAYYSAPTSYVVPSPAPTYYAPNYNTGVPNASGPVPTATYSTIEVNGVTYFVAP